MGEWKNCTLSSLGTIVGGATPSTKKPENYEGGEIPWITPKDLSGFSGRYISCGERNITEIGLKNCSAQMMPKHSVLFSSRAPIGYVAISNCDVCTNQGFKSIVPNNDTDYLFLYYLLLYKKHEIENLGSGTTFKEVSASTMKGVEVRVPIDKREQERIAGILSALDDKIESNAHINENLEQQVQTLFADWLSANSESATEIALGNICTKVTDGSHFSPKDDSTSSIPMLSVKDMREFDFDLTSCKHICEDDYEKMVANDCVPQVNDILVAKDGSYLKEIFICNEKRKLAILSSIAIFRPNTTVIHPEILLAFLKSPRVLQEVRDNYVSGSALPRIVLKDFKKLTFSLPDMDAQNLIAPLFASIREQIAVNVTENKYMTQLRDTLLPKLMSGELNVDNIHL